MRRLLKGLAILVFAMLLGIIALVSPAAYVEALCHGEPQAQTYVPLIKDPEQSRAEANTYLTYPEWHIVYAYDGLAETLKSGDEYQFPYWESVKGFWTTDCALTRIADAHGGADTDTRLTIATIGVSFTLEMGLKAAYEDTIGRLTAWWRGAPEDTAGYRRPRHGDRLCRLPPAGAVVQVSVSKIDRRLASRTLGWIAESPGAALRVGN